MYAEMDQVEPGLRFKTRSDLVVETTGKSLQVMPHNASEAIYAHEVVVKEGPHEGNIFLHNLDAAQAL